MGLLVPIIAPFIVCYNLIYIPLTHRVFPTTFIVGMILMALLMSACQAMLRRSTTWLYGIWFCLYYELILLWQMPVAWFTFWKSTWGTRMTPADVAEQERKKGANKDAQPKIAGPAEAMVPAKAERASIAEPVMQTVAEAGIPATLQAAAEPVPSADNVTPVPEPVSVEEKVQPEAVVLPVTEAVASLPVEAKEEIQVTPPAPETKVEQPVAQFAVKETAEIQTARPAAKETAEIQTARPAAKETAEIHTARPAVKETAAETTDARKAEVEARQEERRRSFTDNVFNQEAIPYIAPRYTAGMHPQPYGRDISEDLAREQEALIELIRENQKQVSELHRLMEKRIELEKMRIAAYHNTRSEYYKEESTREQDALQKNQEEDKP